MIKNFIFIVIVIIFYGCTSTGESPTIVISSVSINGEIQNENYPNDEIIELKEKDALELTLLLNGNGGDLQAFLMACDEGSLDTELVYDDNAVTTEGNLTDPANGHLRFLDGVNRTEVSIMSTIETISKDDEEIILSFYLSSNSANEGARSVITLKIDK